jgi:phenylpropionate dioxygenase-like ring-hydroxylating dioxygenase large terminal subunit
MEHALQVKLAGELFEHMDAGTTCLADDIATNPIDRYTDARRLEREIQILFRHYPLMMGLSCRIPEPGDYFTDENCGLPLLVVRGYDGEVRAFLNVCRHRGAQVARGCGHLERRFVCPYHGWSYDDQGKLVGIPDGRNFEGVGTDNHGLVALPADERFGCIWVQPEPGTRFDIEKELAGLGPELASYGFRNYHYYATHVLQRRMNWKMLIDTFLEPYHFAVLHTETVAPIFLHNLCLFHPFGFNLRETLPRHSISEMRAQPQSQWDLVKHSAIVYVLFPNSVIVMQSDHAEVWRVFPVDGKVDQCVAYLEFYIPEAATSESAHEHWRRNIDLTLRTVEEEDFPTGESIQRSLLSGAQSHLTYGRNEPALQHWQKSVTAALDQRDGRSRG